MKPRGLKTWKSDSELQFFQPSEPTPLDAHPTPCSSCGDKFFIIGEASKLRKECYILFFAFTQALGPAYFEEIVDRCLEDESWQAAQREAWGSAIGGGDIIRLDHALGWLRNRGVVHRATNYSGYYHQDLFFLPGHTRRLAPWPLGEGAPCTSCSRSAPVRSI